MAIRVVVFDLGGVVCRFVPERRLAALAAASGLGEGAIRARIWESGLDARVDAGDLDAGEAHEAVCQALGIRLAPEELGRRWALAWEPDPAVLALVDRLRRPAGRALLTDNGPILLAAMPHALPDVARRFDWLLFSCALRATKPSQELFARALARVGCAPPEALLVDDRAANVEGARAAGLDAHRYTGPEALAAVLAGAGLLESGPPLG